MAKQIVLAWRSGEDQVFTLVEVDLDPDLKVRDLVESMRQYLHLNIFRLWKPSGQPFALDEDLYGQVISGQRIQATAAPLMVPKKRIITRFDGNRVGRGQPHCRVVEMMLEFSIRPGVRVCDVTRLIEQCAGVTNVSLIRVDEDSFSICESFGSFEADANLFALVADGENLYALHDLLCGSSTIDAK